MKLPPIDVRWVLMAAAILAGYTPEPKLIDRQRAMEIAAKANANLSGFPRPEFDLYDRGFVWAVRVQDKVPVLGGHRFIFISKRSGDVVRVLEGK